MDTCQCGSEGQSGHEEGCLGYCQWFLLCENPAVKTVSHPVLGAVPICERCNERLENI